MLFKGSRRSIFSRCVGGGSRVQVFISIETYIQSNFDGSNSSGPSV